MESIEASSAVFSRIQSIDPENASRIMGYILLQHGEKDMIRFAYGPESLIVSIVNRAKTDLGILSNTSSAPVVSPISNPIAISRPNPLSLSLSSSRLPINGFNPSSPSSPSVWSPHHSPSPNASHSLSYAAVVDGTYNSTNGPFSPSVGFTGNRNSNRESFVDDYHHLQDQNQNHPFLSDPLGLPSKNGDFFEQSMDLAMSPSCRSDSVVYPFSWENSNGAGVENNPHFHRRSASFNDVYYGTDDSTSGFGFKPCLYFARGYCKNGSTCKFVHGGGGAGFSDLGDNSGPIVGSPCNYDAFEQCQEEMLRSKFAQQQRLAAQLMASGVNLPYNKLNFLQSKAQRSAAAALMMREELHKLNRVRMARNEFSGMGMRGDSNPGSRQIYLTFPADSTFKEEDVSQYFSTYGPVQDVRIPYQQKRMFGFVTFVYAETVNIILAKGNPHFVLDSRVLVKPYKEKGKLPDKKHQQQQLERGDFSCSSPSGLDCREPFEFQLGGREFYTQEMLLKKKMEEQADLQQALALQGRRLMNLQLLELKNHQHHQQTVGSPLPSPNLSQAHLNQNALPPSSGVSQDTSEELKESPTGAPDQLAEGNKAALCDDGNGNDLKKENKIDNEECQLPECLEHILPDSLFASPTKSTSENRAFSPALAELDDGAAITGSSSATNSDPSMPASSPLNMAPHKSCFFEMPRLSSGQGALGM